MKAAVYTRYGGLDALEIHDVPEPAPGRGEVLVAVRAAGVNPKDVLVRKGKFRAMTGRSFPQRLGYDWAGEVLAVGPGVTEAAPGDRLFGMVDSWKAGACAERVVAKLDECAPMPESLSFEEAASLPLSSQTALQALRDLGRVRPGAELLVNGASGGVGTLAVQIARALGARVTAVSSAANHELVRSLGADAVVDYRAADPLTSQNAYDVIFDVFGNRRWDQAKRALRAGGTYVTTVPSGRIVIDALRSLLGRRRARLVVVRSRRSDLLAIARMVGEGRLRPVVEKVFPLARIAEAHAHLETKRARGKVVLVPSAPDPDMIGKQSAKEGP